ncbi:potassium transporter Kup [Azospirillum endophyticum]
MAGADAQHGSAIGHPGRAAAAFGALGVVYGDIGTSPLYALREAATAAGGGQTPSGEAILGVVSLILWSLIVVVSFKYAILILRADNRGEGGIIAMLALLRAREAKPRTWRAGLVVLGLFGAALLYGDGVITPAISVLSAVEGLKVDAPGLAPAVIPLTVLILIALFAIQHRGTGFIGRVFGPVMLGWFVLIGVLGIGGILRAPDILAAVSPTHAVACLLRGGWAVGFAVLGAAFLAVTGGEAMYADLGHFGRGPIRSAWFSIVLPALALNYLGQGALLLVEPDALESPFYKLAPDWAHYGLVAFATAATIIASQALISGAFSLTRQAILLGFFPRMHIRHTASHEIGQIYMPTVNWALAVGTLTAVLVFESSSALAGAYGLAVSLLMAITSVLAALVALQWGYSPLLVVAVNGAFLGVDLVFFGANSLKLFEGGWFPLLLTAAVAFLMLTWRRGLMLVETARKQLREPEAAFLRSLKTDPPIRLPGTAVFLTSSPTGIPLPLTQFRRHTNALPERILLVTVLIAETPRVPLEERTQVTAVAARIFRVVLRFGFMEEVSVPEGLRCAHKHELLWGVSPDRISYYIGHETIIATDHTPGMAVWREALFGFLQRNAERTAAYFCVPTSQVVEVGREIEI